MRDRELVRADVRDGYVTAEQARDIYGFTDDARATPDEDTGRHDR